MIELKGKPVAQNILGEIKEYLEKHPEVKPILQVLTADPNEPYVKGILKDADYCGISVEVLLNNHHDFTGDCHGHISLVKGVKSPYERLDLEGDTWCPPTVQAVAAVLQHYNVPIAGAGVVILGRSERVGAPLAELLTLMDATVTLCHSKSPKDYVNDLIYTADIVVSCVGNAKFDDIYTLNRDATLVDVGGDFLESNYMARKVPFVGGVGPVTRACLLDNLIANYSDVEEFGP